MTTKNKLKEMEYVFYGQPFVQVPAKVIDLSGLEFAFNGQPFNPGNIGVAADFPPAAEEDTEDTMLGLGLVYLGQPLNFMVPQQGLSATSIEESFAWVG